MGKLHPKVEKFKRFVQKHPELIRHVRENNESWQSYFDRWIYYGEDDPYWDQFKTSSKPKSSATKQQEGMQKLLGMLEKIDLEKVQKNIEQLSGTLSNVQSIMSQFQKSKPPSPFGQRPGPFQGQRPFSPYPSQPNQPKNPFNFGND
ncbi:MAG: YlbD family protein [Bacillaceae bacterium]|nr:YlbD family protein [Bacillaceae bacterium]